MTRIGRVAVFGLSVVLAALWQLPAAQAQLGGFGGGGLGGLGGGGGFGGGGGGAAGVLIDAQGVLRVKRVRDTRGDLQRRRFEAARAELNPQMIKPNRLRKVSLTRLERAVAARLARGEEPTDEMKYLAGLLKIQYVFFYPETGDLVIAGPAEGFAPDLAGRVRGLTTGRAVLQLEDLIVALRAFAPGSEPTAVIGCSIDPTPEGLKRMQNLLARMSRQIDPRYRAAATRRIVAGLKQALGPQVVTVEGVSGRTHFAQVLVEADYRMKLIGIGLEPTPLKKMRSYVDRANPRAVSRNAMSRWYFTPDYESVRVSDDHLAMELVGWGAKLIGEDEFIARNGQIRQDVKVNAASRQWCREFTEKFGAIADRTPVFAQLRNLMDLTIMAAYIREQGFYDKLNWDLGVFADESKLPVERFVAPRQVETAVNAIWKGNALMTPVGGGVQIEPMRALRSTSVQHDEDGKLAESRGKIDVKRLPADRWWWD